jgi:hypothetical protein
MIEKKETGPPKSRFFFEDSETKMKYRRIVVGLALPGVRPGFIAVVAEELKKDPTLQVRIYRLLAEAEDPDINALFRKGVDSRGIFKVQEFLGNSENKPLMDILRLFNNGLMEKYIPGLNLSPAPYIKEEGSFYYYANMVRTHLKQDRKNLYLGEGSKVARCLQALPPEEILKASSLDFPAIAALGYAVAYLDSWQPNDNADNWRDRIPEESNRYSIFGMLRNLPGYRR